MATNFQNCIREARESNLTQKECRERYKDGMGQKVYWFLQLDKQCPILNLYNHAMLNSSHEDYLRIDRVSISDMITLSKRLSLEWLEEKNRTLVLTGHPTLTQATQEEVAEFFKIKFCNTLKGLTIKIQTSRNLDNPISDVRLFDGGREIHDVNIEID